MTPEEPPITPPAIQIHYKDGSVTDVPDYKQAWFQGNGRWFVVKTLIDEKFYVNGSSIKFIKFLAREFTHPGEPK